MEIYVLVNRKRNPIVQIAACLCLALGIALICVSCSYPVLSAFSLIAFVGWFLLQFRTNKEFEYSYFDGEIHFTKIMNKSRRKSLKEYSMDEVLTIAPSEDRSVYQYLNDMNVQKIDYTSGKKDCPFYVLVTKHNEALTAVKFEPDEAILDAMCMKYRQKIIRRVPQFRSPSAEVEPKE